MCISIPIIAPIATAFWAIIVSNVAFSESHVTDVIETSNLSLSTRHGARGRETPVL